MDENAYKAEHRRRIVEGQNKSGNVGGRPRKEVNIGVVKDRLRKGIPLAEIAAGQHVSVSTLCLRMKEAGVKKRYD